MAEGIALRAQLAFHLRASSTGAEGSDQAVVVDLDQLAHALKRYRQHRLAAGLRVDMPGHRGATAVRDNDQVLLTGPGQQFADLRSAFRVGYAIGEHTEIAGAHRQPVRQALATGVPHAVFGIQADQWMSLQSRGRHRRQHLLQAGISQRLTCANQLGQKCLTMGRQLHHRCVITPAVPTSHLCLPDISVTCNGCLY